MKIGEKSLEEQWVKSDHHFFVSDSVNDGGKEVQSAAQARRKNVSAASTTFAQLKQCMADRVDQPGFPRKASLPNLLSALNAFLSDLGLDLSHAVGTTLRSDCCRSNDKWSCPRSGIPFSTLQRLCRGGAPTQRSMRYLRRLERFLGMAEGALTDLIGGGRVAVSDSTAATESIPYRIRLRELAQDSYAVKKDVCW